MMRYRWDKKTTVEETPSVSTIFLRKHGYLKGGMVSGGIDWSDAYRRIGSIGICVETFRLKGTMRCCYSHQHWQGAEKLNLDYTVELTTTPCRFGGHRWWFICPLVWNSIPCERRVERLYLGGKHLGCRRCYDLTYISAQQHDSRVGSWLKLLQGNNTELLDEIPAGVMTFPLIKALTMRHTSNAKKRRS